MKKFILISLFGLIFLFGCGAPDRFQGDIEEVLKLDGSYNCSAYKEGEYDLHILIKGTKLRGTADTPAGVIESVGDVRDCVYGWYQQGGPGEVVCITKEEVREGVSLLKKSGDTNILLSCEKYKINDDIFQKPENKEFVATIGP